MSLRLTFRLATLGKPNQMARESGSIQPPMPADTVIALINAQIGHEFAAHQQYVACAVHYESETLPELARFFYRQALEEREHAMMLVGYLLDSDAPVEIPALPAPQGTFADVVAPVALALDQE